jgi:anti-sigma factor RsiW
MKKECEFFKGKLIDYALDELDAEPELKKKIEEHTASCTDCWAEVDGYRKTSSLAASVMRVDFSGDVWEMQRKQIIKRVTRRVNVLAEIGKFFTAAFTTRKLAAGFALFIVLAAGVGAGAVYYNNAKQLEKERTITSRIDLLDNMEIIERLDFYKEMSDQGVAL